MYVCVCDSHFFAVCLKFANVFLFIKNNFLFSSDVSLNRVFPLIKNICFLVPFSVILFLLLLSVWWRYWWRIKRSRGKWGMCKFSFFRLMIGERQILGPCRRCLRELRMWWQMCDAWCEPCSSCFRRLQHVLQRYPIHVGRDGHGWQIELRSFPRIWNKIKLTLRQN